MDQLLLNLNKSYEQEQTTQTIAKHGSIENKVDEFLLLKTNGKTFYDIVQEGSNPKELSFIASQRVEEFTKSQVNPSMVRRGIESYSLEQLKTDEKTFKTFVSSLLKMYLSKS